MVFAYLLNSLFREIYTFFNDWYVRVSRYYFLKFIEGLRRIDRYFAWKITLKNIFSPLYQDYSFTGRVLGIFFRVLRLFFGVFVYFLFSLAAFIFFAMWCTIPPLLVLLIFVE